MMKRITSADNPNQKTIVADGYLIELDRTTTRIFVQREFLDRKTMISEVRKEYSDPALRIAADRIPSMDKYHGGRKVYQVCVLPRELEPIQSK